MPTLDNVHHELRERIERLLEMGNNRLKISSAFRSRIEQQQLYDHYLRYGTPLAARPGNSKHERNPAEAVDIWADKPDEDLRKRCAYECGLHMPVPGEPWHMELAPHRTPIPPRPNPPKPKTLTEASLMIGQKAVEILSTTNGEGYYIIANDGGVFCFGDANFVGSMGGQPLAEPIIGAALHPSNHGYWLLGEDGGVFAFGRAEFHGSAVENIG